MKKVVKVSIGNLAFTIDEDGYELLKSYLGELRAHYRLKPSGNEIVEGIEERMAELFIEKAGINSVVSFEIVKEVINILGRPEVIDEESAEDFNERKDSSYRSIPRRLFRDPDNKMIGGVCSGLAAYINTDPLLIRILFIIFFLGFSFLGTHIGGPIFMLLLYCVLWIMIPEAKTVEQKCAMRGEGVDLHNIQRRVEDGASKFSEYVRNSSSDSNSTMTKVSKVVTKIFAILFIISAIIGILSLTLLFLGIEIMNGFFPINLFDFVEFGITNPFWMKLLIILVLLLPLVWMFIVGIQTLAGSRARRFRPGLIIFIIWAISFFSLGIVGAIASKPFWSQATEEVSYALRGDLDTIYIQLESDRKMPIDNLLLEADHSSFNLLWVDESGKELVIFPEIDIIRQSEESARELVCETSTMSNTYGEALLKGRNMPQCVDVKDSLITIRSDIYSKSTKWSGTTKEIKLFVPENVKVIITKPVNFDFSHRYRSDFKWVGNCKHFHSHYRSY